jgi:hypothetical protein
MNTDKSSQFSGGLFVRSLKALGFNPNLFSDHSRLLLVDMWMRLASYVHLLQHLWIAAPTSGILYQRAERCRATKRIASPAG